LRSLLCDAFEYHVVVLHSLCSRPWSLIKEGVVITFFKLFYPVYFFKELRTDPRRILLTLFCTPSKRSFFLPLSCVLPSDGSFTPKVFVSTYAD
jgi:hypothetical protein